MESSAQKNWKIGKWKVKPRKIGKLEKWKNGKLGPEKLENWKVGKVASCPRKSVFCRYLPVKIGKCRRMGGGGSICMYVCIYIYICIYIFTCKHVYI